MTTLTAQCPACKTPLRLKDKIYTGRHFDCPDCKLGLCVASSNHGTILLEIKSPELKPDTKNSKEQTVETISKLATYKANVLTSKSRMASWFHSILKDPWVVIWLLALSFTFLFIRVVLWPRPVAKPVPKPSALPETAQTLTTINQGQASTPSLVPSLPKPPVLTGQTDPPSLTNLPNEPPINKPVQSTTDSPDVNKEKTPKPIDNNINMDVKPEANQPGKMKVLGVDEPQTDGTLKESLTKVDLVKTLSFKIKHYSQAKPLKANLLLVELEQLTGVEINTYPGDLQAATILAQQDLQLSESKDITVRELLESAAQQLNLELKILEQAIFIHSPGFQNKP